MAMFPGHSADSSAWGSWLNALRPTKNVSPNVAAQELPLRVVDCEELFQNHAVKTITPPDWNFAAISHTWAPRDTHSWDALPSRPYPGDGPWKVTACSQDALYVVAGICLAVGLKHLWIDCLCTDQGNAVEKSSEIIKMGSIYRKAEKTLIFPYGIDEVGPALLPTGKLPRWHGRVWTLQEEVMSSDKAYFILYAPVSTDADTIPVPAALNEPSPNPTQKLSDFTILLPHAPDPGVEAETPVSGQPLEPSLHLVKRDNIIIARIDQRQAMEDRLDPAKDEHLDPAIDAEITANIWGGWLQIDWNLHSAILEMYRRESRYEEDRVYGLLALSGVVVSPSAIQYGIGIRGAVRVLVEAMHLDQRLFLTVIEGYRTGGQGCSALPSFNVPPDSAKPAPRLKHLRLLGEAIYVSQPCEGLVIIAPTTKVDLVHDPDAEVGIGLDDLAGGTVMFRYNYSSPNDPSPQQQSCIGMVDPSVELKDLVLVAATQISNVNDDIWDVEEAEKQAGPIMFCCLVCVEQHGLLRKVGLALVKPEGLDWSMSTQFVQ